MNKEVIGEILQEIERLKNKWLSNNRINSDGNFAALHCQPVCGALVKEYGGNNVGVNV